MALRPISRFLLRAPLWPVAAVERSTRALFAEPLARAALALASPDLFAQLESRPTQSPTGGAKHEAKRKAKGRTKSAPAKKGAASQPTAQTATDRALGNYARRAAFRPTPHGLWAGVTVGELGARTRIATGAPRACLRVAWGRLAALGRALLDEPELRDDARLRVAPSLLRDDVRALWLAFGEGAESETRAADLDPPLACVLDATQAWRPWHEVRAALAAVQPGDDDALDEYLLLLVDDGLLAHDLEPPLVGPEPLEWMRVRLGARLPLLAELGPILDDGRHAPLQALAAARELLMRLPGAGDEQPLHALLVHEPPRTPSLSRAAVERAAALAPLLFRLQAALVPPAAERLLDPSTAESLDAVTEIYGAGALDLAALARGDYGTPLDGGAAPTPPTPPPSPLLAFLVDALVSAARDGADHVDLASEAVDALLPSTALPPTFELTLTPAPEPRGQAPGTDWLLGLHAPAGATWGRFAGALGAPLVDALAELAAAEQSARPGETRLDVAYAPSRALADLTAHPPVRAATLALSSWPAAEARVPSTLELCADPAALAALAPLALRAGATPVVPSPLHRVRSTTAPSGVYRLLCGFSLYRQHAPWALQLGPLADLAHLPRVSIDGFVVAPASWRLPDGDWTPARLAKWRAQAGVPRWVQLGREDELLLVDLDDRHAADALTRHAADALARRVSVAEAAPRAFEIWPPLDATLDADGRRVEAVVAVIDVPDADQARLAAAAAQATATVGRVPPPRVLPPAAGWRTWKLFGAADRADRVLLDAAAVLREARDTHQIDRWFFLRYIDGPGRREHLRVRCHAADPRALVELDRTLAQALGPARAAGDLCSVETADYYRELARYGADAMDAVERLFESDSQLVCDLLTDDSDPDADTTELLVRSYDALASGLGLSVDERRALARTRRATHATLLTPAPLSSASASANRDPLAAEHRARKPRLLAALATPSAPFTAHATRVSAAQLPPARRDALLAPLLHLAAVRLCGPDRPTEARALYFWDRTLDALAHLPDRGQDPRS